MDHQYGAKGLRNRSADEDGDESSSCDTSVASSNPSFELESENHQNINDDDDNDDESESASTNVSSRSYHPQEGKDIFDSNEETDDENNVAENAVEQSDNLEAEIIGDNVLDGNATQLLDSLDINEVQQLAGNIIMHEENISNNPSTVEENPDDTSNQKNQHLLAMVMKDINRQIFLPMLVIKLRIIILIPLKTREQSFLVLQLNLMKVILMKRWIMLKMTQIRTILQIHPL